MNTETQVTVVERAAVALGADEGERALIDLSKKYVDIVEIKNRAGREQCHAAAMTLTRAMTGTDKIGKDAREDAVAFQKAVVTETKRRVDIVKPERDRLLALRDAWDESEAAEKAAKLAAEKARVERIRARIEGIMLDGVTASRKSAAEIAGAADRISEMVISLEEFGEFAGEAQVKRNDTVAFLREKHAEAVAHEAEQARLAAERAELARLRAEQEGRDRVAAEERAAQERKEQAERLERERREREVREQEEADRREAQRRAQEAMDAEREAHEARMAADRAKLEQEQAALAAERRRHMEEAEAARIEQERIAREARERAEAEALARKIEADHVEGLAENARIDAERAQAERIAAEGRAKDAERRLRLRVEFEENGPGDLAIVEAIANRFEVSESVAAHWLAKFDATPFIEPMEKVA